jgi:flavin-dependent dehydrogenase
MSTTYDVVIVGGGLAGLSAAQAIVGASDARVALVEGRGLGSNNPTPLICTEVVERFGLASCAKARYRKFTFLSPRGVASSHCFDSFALTALDYQAACRLLFERCQELGRVALFSDCARQVARSTQGQWVISLAGGAELSAPLLVDASGKSFFSARSFNLERPRMFSHSLGEVLAGASYADPSEAFYIAPSEYGDGGGWFYPLARGRASFGVATLTKDARFPERWLKESLRRARAGLHPCCEWLAGAWREHFELGSIPVFPPRRFVHPGLVRIGDAAGQATIWSCMGCEMALVGGQMAGHILSEAVREHEYSLELLNQYQERWDEAYRRIYRQAAWLAPLVWQQDDQQWERSLRLLQALTPAQMLARLRTNWPVLPLWKIGFIRAYDLLGRCRRAAVRRTRRALARGIA